MQRILGQQHAVDILQRALASGRLHHAWIFSGPRGVGKFTTALEFARVLLDPAAGPDLTGRIAADPDAAVSRMIDAGSHPDLHVIRKELALVSDVTGLDRRKLSNIPLDVLRERMIGGKTSDDKYRDAPAYRTAALGHGKVFIIDEAELVDVTGQNALLKTLEEPPAQTYIFLVTSREERLLPTIRSRCQKVRFGPLDDASMAAWFDRAELGSGEDDADLDEHAIAWITRFAGGAPGVAKLAAEYGFHQWQQRLDPLIAQVERGRFPVEMGETLAELVESFAARWVKQNQNASKDAANKDGAAHLLSVLAAEARRRLHETCTPPGNPARAIALIELLRDAERQLASNVNAKQVLENLSVQWSRLGRTAPDASIAELLIT